MRIVLENVFTLSSRKGEKGRAGVGVGVGGSGCMTAAVKKTRSNCTRLVKLKVTCFEWAFCVAGIIETTDGQRHYL